MFKKGLSKMIEVLKPKDVIVHGRMPDEIFSDFSALVNFHHFLSEFEKTHEKVGAIQ